MAIGIKELTIRFSHHPVDDPQAVRMQQIRTACLELAVLVDKLAPDSREKSDALTNLDYVMYQANAAIARR